MSRLSSLWKRCEGCRIIAYCSRAHQMKHWPEHKYLCKEISNGVDIAEKLIEEASSSKNSELSWTEVQHNIIKSVAMASRYQLSFEEVQILAYNRSCEICHETDSKKLHDCTECPAASFCIKHPKDSKHSVKCETMKLCLEYDGLHLECDNLSVYNDMSTPLNINEVIGPYLSRASVVKHIKSEKIWTIFLSERLTRPYTLLHSMEKLPHPKLHKMTIHVIGSDRNEMEQVRLWFYLIHHNKTLRELKIVFIGPELESSSHEFNICDERTKNTYKMKVYTVSSLYAEFAAEQFFTKPDYVIGFNLELCAFPLCQDTWAPTIEVLAKLGCPFSLTAYCSYEQKCEQERINLFLDKEIEPLWAGKNPFSGLRPFREVEDEFCYVNQYLTVYEKLCCFFVFFFFFQMKFTSTI
ncbi:uncharacterized protein [Venturia canescens]|uniref:uncharacterized protein n=1 Tax=Venturia canescens TaxID=32260 RepID=UPI001C9D52FC|nr:uncharacterized protein LOC122414494 [Venturia canescens]XP_043281749.1 uncharacterized protein LOC122414494 [Venturia canescens]XP_043281750.1 uncharacterized protein LOC122414494 [Venturia canescens]XP_043281751.1 uncharacterized protein LOC122414494 [Venturia canescens]XP_043281752.1 uncharacterized protein LOC122414494 [Venturia canescens]